MKTGRRGFWLDYCWNIESTSESGRLSKIQVKEHRKPWSCSFRLTSPPATRTESEPCLPVFYKMRIRPKAYQNRARLPEFDLSQLNEEERLVLSSNVKYLDVILDPKLKESWGLNIELMVKKTYIAFYTCKRILVRKWCV